MYGVRGNRTFLCGFAPGTVISGCGTVSLKRCADRTWQMIMPTAEIGPRELLKKEEEEIMKKMKKNDGDIFQHLCDGKHWGASSKRCCGIKYSGVELLALRKKRAVLPLWRLLDNYKLFNFHYSTDLLTIFRYVVLSAGKHYLEKKEVADGYDVTCSNFQEKLLCVHAHLRQDARSDETNYNHYQFAEWTLCHIIFTTIDECSIFDDASGSYKQTSKLNESPEAILNSVVDALKHHPIADTGDSWEPIQKEFVQAVKIPLGSILGQSGAYERTELYHAVRFALQNSTLTEECTDKKLIHPYDMAENPWGKGFNQLLDHRTDFTAKTRAQNAEMLCKIVATPPLQNGATEYIKAFSPEDKDGTTPTTSRNDSDRTGALENNEEQKRKEQIDAQEASGNQSFADEPWDFDQALGDSADADVQSKSGFRFDDKTVGCGQPCTSPNVVLTLLGETSPVYFISLDTERLHMSYTPSNGLTLGFLVDRKLLSRFFDKKQNPDHREQDLVDLRWRLLKWLGDVLRSPLHQKYKQWFLMKLKDTCEPPPEAETNTKVIAHCLSSSFPTITKLSEMMRNSLISSLTCKGGGVGKELQRHLKRQGGEYGIYSVKGSTLQQLENFNLKVSILASTTLGVRGHKPNINKMYLDITSRFTGYCCVVYIRPALGRRGYRIDDTLLKWLAEYTRMHPWRFVYFENADLTWNYSENRDRVCFDLAADPASRVVRKEADLVHVRDSKRSHAVTHPRGTSGLVLESEDAFEKWYQNLPDKCSAAKSTEIRDFEAQFDRLGTETCVIMLESPPGAGKTYSVEKHLEKLRNTRQMRCERMDGSDDQLVTKALQRILSDKVPAHGEAVLVVDEYHMLNNNHRDELIEWLVPRLNRLSVVFIANRLDQSDEERVGKCTEAIGEERVHTIHARLTLKKLKEFCSGAEIESSDRLATWLTCCRLIFGNQSVSLRAFGPIRDVLDDNKGEVATRKRDLAELLSNKMPTISYQSANQFVEVFWRDVFSMPNNASGRAPSTAMEILYDFAKLDQAEGDKGDTAMTFPEFVKEPGHKMLEYPPSVRLAAWCIYMKQLHEPARKVIDFKPLLETKFIDQTGFPFQLEENCRVEQLREGKSFSWEPATNDYSDLLEIKNAINHGHSVDWESVKRDGWGLSLQAVTDCGMLNTVLSVCSEKAQCLDALLPQTLDSLLVNSLPKDSYALSEYLIGTASKHVDTETSKDNNNFALAVWNVIRFRDEHGALKKPKHLLDMIKSSASSNTSADEHWERLHVALVWARTHASQLRNIQVPDEAAAHERVLYLTGVMVYISIELMKRGSPEKVCELWSCDLFARLLNPDAIMLAYEKGYFYDGSDANHGSKEQVEKWIVHLVYCVMGKESKSSTMFPAWPQPIKILHRLLKYQGIPESELDFLSKCSSPNKLLDFNYRPPQALKEVGVTERTEENWPTRFACGVLLVKGVLPDKIQEEMLQSDKVFIPDTFIRGKGAVSLEHTGTKKTTQAIFASLFDHTLEQKKRLEKTFEDICKISTRSVSRNFCKHSCLPSTPALICSCMRVCI